MDADKRSADRGPADAIRYYWCTIQDTGSEGFGCLVAGAKCGCVNESDGHGQFYVFTLKVIELIQILQSQCKSRGLSSDNFDENMEMIYASETSATEHPALLSSAMLSTSRPAYSTSAQSQDSRGAEAEYPRGAKRIYTLLYLCPTSKSRSSDMANFAPRPSTVIKITFFYLARSVFCRSSAYLFYLGP